METKLDTLGDTPELHGRLDPGPVARGAVPFKRSDAPPPVVDRRKPPERRNVPDVPPRAPPLTRAELDNRTQAAKSWDALRTNIINEVGGEAQVSSVKLALIDGFCLMTMHLQDLGVRSLLGQDISLSDIGTAASTMTRLAARIGIERRAKDVTASLGELRRLDLQKQREEAKP